MPTRSYEDLREDLAQLKAYTLHNRKKMEDKRVLTAVIELTSRAEARLDGHGLFSDPISLVAAHRHMTRAWVKIQAPMMTDSEIGEGVA